MKMREIINIIESHIISEGKAYRLSAETGEPFVAVENPTKEQLDNIRKNAPYQELKGLLSMDGRRLIVWPSYYAHHGEALGYILGYSTAELFPHGTEDDMFIVPEMSEWACVFPGVTKIWTDDGEAENAVIANSPIVRRLYNTVTETATWSPDQDNMIRIANSWDDQYERGHEAGGPAERFHWRFEPEWPIDRVIDGLSPKRRISWMKAEIKMWVDEGDPDRFDDILKEPIEEPVVAIEVNGRAFLWDGNHRVGGSLLTGRKMVPAIVGTLKLNEGYADENDSGEWRAWIDPTGCVLEIPDDQTHAEYAYYQGMDNEYKTLPDDEAGPDHAFDDVFDKGWIRVAIPSDASSFNINFDLSAATSQSLKSLLRLFDSHYTDSYMIETLSGANRAHKVVKTEKQAKSIITRIIVAKNK